MIYFNRPDAPLCLTQIVGRKLGLISNQDYWGILYEAKLNNPLKSNKFEWATYNKIKVNKLIIDDLKTMTHNHCAFCDIYPLKQSGPTIEHFKPKLSYPKESYLWENLFYCCNTCQKTKLENFNLDLLKPDDISYQFNKYFICRYDGEAILLKPNPRASDPDILRAVVTIELYGLNDHERPEARYIEYLKFRNQNNLNINVNDWSYRFLFY